MDDVKPALLFSYHHHHHPLFFVWTDAVCIKTRKLKIVSREASLNKTKNSTNKLYKKLFGHEMNVIVVDRVIELVPLTRTRLATVLERGPIVCGSTADSVAAAAAASANVTRGY